MTIQDLHLMYNTDSETELLYWLMKEVMQYRLEVDNFDKTFVLVLLRDEEEYRCTGTTLLSVFAQAIEIQMDWT